MNKSTVHSTAVVGPEVQIFGDVYVGPYSVVMGRTTLQNCTIGSHCVIGAPPENRGSVNKGVTVYSGVHILNHVVIQGGSNLPTRIGEGSYICSGVQIAHDVILDGDNTLYAGATIGGHCILEPKSNVGAGAAVHQFVILGPESMVGMNAAVTKHIPPMMTVAGVPAAVIGRNKRTKGTPMGWYKSWVNRCAARPERQLLELNEEDWRYYMGMQ